MNFIEYKSGYKYQLNQTYYVQVDIKPSATIWTEYIDLDTNGMLKISEGYAWDGPSGPAIDTPDFMRGSLVHDALYQLMREGHLPHAIYRESADQTLRKICIEDGMSSIRAWWVYHAVRLFADPLSTPSSIKPAIRAPR